MRVLPTVTWGSFCICQWFFCLQFDMNLYLLCMSGKVLTGGKASSKQRENLVTTWGRGYSAALKALPPLPPFPLHFLPISLKSFLLSKKKKNLAITCWQGYFVAWKALSPLPIPSSSSFLRTFLHCFFYWLFVYTSYFKSILGHSWPFLATLGPMKWTPSFLSQGQLIWNLLWLHHGKLWSKSFFCI